MIQILFGQSAAGTLNYVLQKLGHAKDEQFIKFWENFSVGPIWHLQNEEGKEARFAWMKNIISEEFEQFYQYTQSYIKVIEQIKSMSDEPVSIWISENAGEQTGLRYVLYLLKDKTNKVKIINTTKVHTKLFNRPDIQYVVRSTGEVPPDKLQIIYEEAQKFNPLSQIERKELEEEWLSLAENKETLRIWLNGKIQCVSEGYYDQYIIDRAKMLHQQRETKEFMKLARLIGDVLGNLDQHLGDEFLEYRLKKLIEKGVFEVEGRLDAMRFYSVRLKK